MEESTITLEPFESLSESLQEFANSKMEVQIAAERELGALICQPTMHVDANHLSGGVDLGARLR